MEDGFITTAKNRYGELVVFGKNRNIATNLGKSLSNLDYEKQSVRIVEKGNYDLFVDIGAAFGYFTRIAAAHTKLVVAVEAHPLRYGFLLRNIRDVSNVKGLNTFIGKGKVFIPKHRFNSMVGTNKNDRNFSIDVKKVALNSLLESKEVKHYTKGNVLIKIDVEGNELDVLQSAGRYLVKNNITWLIERHPWAASHDNLLNMMKEHKHKIIMPHGKTTVYKFWKEE